MMETMKRKNILLLPKMVSSLKRLSSIDVIGTIISLERNLWKIIHVSLFCI